jgi:hypothetical protein
VDQRILPALYSSVESAVEQAGFLREQGREAVVMDPEGWQVWPAAANQRGRPQPRSSADEVGFVAEAKRAVMN